MLCWDSGVRTSTGTKTPLVSLIRKSVFISGELKWHGAHAML